MQDAGGNTVGLTDGSAIHEPVLSGGLPEGTSPPAPGDAPANAYGGPAVPMTQYGIGTPNCERDMSLVYLDDPCVAYVLCSIECRVDADCPTAGSGDTTAICDGPPTSPDAKTCKIPCDASTTCPTGMTCVYSDGVGQCLWPEEIARPGCPTWCDVTPLPRDCPGWCATQGVGCNPAETGYCCTGLACGPGGYCVKEG